MKILGNDIPPLGMGCWAIGGQFYAGDEAHGFPDINDAESRRTIDAALDAGIRLFDTAAVYGAGHSERLLGEALKSHPDALVVTKLGTAIDEEKKQVLGDEREPGQVANAIDSSLSRLQRDRIDIMLLHLNSLSLEIAVPIFTEMEKAITAGKLRAFGWSTDFPDSADHMAKMDGFICIEHAMNVFIDVPTIQQSVAQNNLIALLRSPLAMGILTGKFKPTTTVPTDDVRCLNNTRRDYFTDGKAAPKYLKNLGAIRELLQVDGRTLSQGALGWAMAKSERNIPIPGARTVEQMEDNAGAVAHGPLPHSVMLEIESLIEREPEGPPRAR